MIVDFREKRILGTHKSAAGESERQSTHDRHQRNTSTLGHSRRTQATRGNTATIPSRAIGVQLQRENGDTNRHGAHARIPGHRGAAMGARAGQWTSTGNVKHSSQRITSTRDDWSQDHGNEAKGRSAQIDHQTRWRRIGHARTYEAHNSLYIYITNIGIMDTQSMCSSVTSTEIDETDPSNS